MTQLTFAEAEYATKKRKTRREIFLEKMDALIPWKQLEKKLSKHYHRGRIGRPPYPLSTMLRVHCLQLFYNLSDPAMEDALYEIESMRRFSGLRLSERIPDETTILNFRHLLESRRLCKVIFESVNRHLANAGRMLREGTIGDATIVEAPSSTKNRENARDPEMHQTPKGQPVALWHEDAHRSGRYPRTDPQHRDHGRRRARPERCRSIAARRRAPCLSGCRLHGDR